jgi:cell division transport system permease protein
MRLWLRLHGQALRAALARIAAQPLGTALAVFVIAIAIALPVLAAVVLKSLAAATAGLDTDPHVNVYLALDATDEDARKLEPRLREHPDAASVRFVPRAQALEELKSTTHLAELLSSLERNPLPHAFTVRMRTTDAARLEALRAAWLQLPKVDQVVSDFEWSGRLSRWVKFGDRALALAAGFLALAVVFIVGHLIRLQVLTQREEIEVSQLIGATAADVRRPFLYHGVVQGLLAGGAAVALAGAVAAWLRYELQALTSTYATEFKVVLVDPGLALAIAVAAALLGWLGAWVSVARELRRFGNGR